MMRRPSALKMMRSDSADASGLLRFEREVRLTARLTHLDCKRLDQFDLNTAALAHAAKHGLPGEHHFYITFRTRAAGVSIPRHLFERFPEEMTIVIQHRFWDLKVDDEGFSVGLSFGGVPATLNVPFATVTAFHDPEVEFSLTFQDNAEEADVEEHEEAGNDVPAEDSPAERV